MVPAAAMISRMAVSSKGSTQSLNSSSAMASAVPIGSGPWTAPVIQAELPTTRSTRANPAPTTRANVRWPRSVSVRSSALSTPMSMITKRNSVMTAPA